MLNMLAMPKRPDEQETPDMVVVSARVTRELRDDVLKIGSDSGWDLTLTQLIERAMREFVEKHSKPRK